MWLSRVMGTEHEPKVVLSKEQGLQVDREIGFANYARLRIIFGMTLVFQLLLIFFHDIPAIGKAVPDELWIFQWYFALHVLMAVVSVLAIVASTALIRSERFLPWITPVFVTSILLLLSVVTGLDQITIGQITVFLSNMVVSMVFLFKPWHAALVYTLPYAVFASGLFLFQQNQQLLIGHLTNGTIAFIGVLTVARFFYSNQYRHLAKNIALLEAYRQLEFLSNHDPLTGLANRRHFEGHLARSLQRMRQGNEQGALIVMDIDHFKRINDTYGHPIGDQVLKKAAAMLLASTRKHDVAARWGGEEFLLLVSSVSLKEAEAFAENLRLTMETTPLLIDTHSILITASFGVSALSAEDVSFDTSYHKADYALYQAKEGGRNRVVVAAA